MKSKLSFVYCTTTNTQETVFFAEFIKKIKKQFFVLHTNNIICSNHDLPGHGKSYFMIDIL